MTAEQDIIPFIRLCAIRFDVQCVLCRIVAVIDGIEWPGNNSSGRTYRTNTTSIADSTWEYVISLKIRFGMLLGCVEGFGVFTIAHGWSPFTNWTRMERAQPSMNI